MAVADSGWPRRGRRAATRSSPASTTRPAVGTHRGSRPNVVVAALGTRFDPDEAAMGARMLRGHAGTMPELQIIDEIGLAIAIHHRDGR